jgi:PLP dependent protein
MSNITANYLGIKATIPAHVKLVAVSKNRSPQEIMEVYKCGQIAFGENKVQELVSKAEQLPGNIYWHMIGHLQTNKVKYIVPFIQMIHSVDSLKLLGTINREARRQNRVIDCLLQMHIAEEETKFGMDYPEVTELLQSQQYGQMEHIRIRGLMGMATFTNDTEKIRKEFRQLATCFNQIKETFFKDDSFFTERSMGMSDDYPLAIDEGSTMIRVGSSIFE